MKTSCCNSKSLHRTENGFICINPSCENYLAATSRHRDFSKWKNPIASSVFSFLLLFSLDDFSMENKEQKLIYMPEVKEIPLTVETLHSELLAEKILCPEHVLAQIKLESGNLTSFLLKRTNNMLGMRYPLNRKTTACGIYIPAKDTVIVGNRDELKKYLKTDNYAVYKSWKDGVADYKIWQESNFNVTERYLTFLGKVYAEDSQYVQKIKQMAAAH
jgi:uncharacterized FlgJ-related protein